MTNVLLIYEIIPDATELFLIPNCTNEEIDVLKSVNNKYINGDEYTKEMELVYSALSEKDSFVLEFGDNSWFDKWSNTKIETPYQASIEPPKRIDLVITTGVVI